MKAINHLTLLMTLGIALLTGCAANQQNRAEIEKQYNIGKVQFINQQYGDAFTNLLGAAEAGKPEAEYAIGYMYFYGKGIKQNETLGRSWIEKAAKEGNQTAKQALQILKQEEISAHAADALK